MMRTGPTYTALSLALAPPGGDASAFPDLDLPAPGASDLESEHIALFGRAGCGVLSPYEGAHHGIAIHEILCGYAAAGFGLDGSFRDRPDHVSVELALMGCLSLQEDQASKDNDPETALTAAEHARAFFLCHIWAWVPDFFDTLARAEGFPIHEALAAQAVIFIRREGACAGATDRAAPGEPFPASPNCRECGKPLGVALPARKELLQPWSTVCVRCRLHADLRRLQA